MLIFGTLRNNSAGWVCYKIDCWSPRAFLTFVSLALWKWSISDSFIPQFITKYRMFYILFVQLSSYGEKQPSLEDRIHSRDSSLARTHFFSLPYMTKVHFPMVIFRKDASLNTFSKIIFPWDRMLAEIEWNHVYVQTQTLEF